MSPAELKTALIVIDPQNDYFPGGKFPLWNTATVERNILALIARCETAGLPVVFIRHVGKPESPFFAEGSEGVAIRPEVLQAAPNAAVVVKKYADGFDETKLKNTLDRLGVKKLWLCGMMTQNCVTHTALSPAATAYEITVVSDCCTTVNEMLHLIALSALGRRVKTLPAGVLHT